MSLASNKVSIFEKVEGPHDMRFVSFNTTPDVNSRFNRQVMMVNSAAQ